MVRPRHQVYHDHIDHIHERERGGKHHITEHYNEHDHRDRDHPANHRNDHHKGHSNDHQREHAIHHGTHPKDVSHHSHNRVSNPNVNHHHAVHERDTNSHTYIHHQNGKTHNKVTHNPNTLPKSPVTNKPATTPPASKKPIPVTKSAVDNNRGYATITGIAEQVVNSARTGTNKPTPPSTPPSNNGNKKTGQAPYHHGLDYGIGNPDPNKRVYGSNEPGQLLATHVSAVDNKGKAVTTHSTAGSAQGYNPVPGFISKVVNKVQRQLHYLSLAPGTETSQQAADDPVWQAGRWEDQQIRHFAQWEVDRLRSIGIEPTP